MKKNNKKGFTIVELVVVIAVIGILAAVLIPTFSNIIEKANISADTQLCRNMNTALSTAKADGREFNDMEDVLFTINEAGYIVEHLNPTTEGYYYAWDSENDQIVFLNKKLNVHYPTDAKINPAECWVTVGSSDEANKIANHGYAVYLEPKLSNKTVSVGSLVSIDGGATTGVDLTVSSSANGSIVVKGNFDEIVVKAENAHIEQYGVANKVTAQVSDSTLVVNGLVKEVVMEKGSVSVAKSGVVNQLTSAPVSGATVTVKASEGMIVEGAKPDNYAAPSDFTISNRQELANFRDVVNGGYNYAGKTVKLTADIDLDGIAWLPIGNFYRARSAQGFAGIFDGQNHTIKNLSNVGFSVAGLNVGKNSSTIAGYNESVYGFFGCVSGATIKNLIVNADIDMMKFNKMVGDSVGAIVGYSYGNLTIENCTANGIVKGHDGVGGLVGRVYGNKVDSVITVTNCTNNVVVTANRKAAGIIGFISEIGSEAAVTMTNCVNNASITSLPSSEDIEKSSQTGYYVAHALVASDSDATAKKITFSGCRNTGTITCENIGALKTPEIA